VWWIEISFSCIRTENYDDIYQPLLQDGISQCVFLMTLSRHSCNTGLHYTTGNNVLHRILHDGLSNCNYQSLQTLKITRNYLNDDHCVQISNAFDNRWTVLLSISLDDNNITDIGAKTLSEAFGNVPSLRRISLSTNWIGDNGCQALTSSLLLRRSKPNILYLKLNNNRVSIDGMTKLIASLKDNTMLRQLTADNQESTTDNEETTIQYNQTIAALILDALWYNDTIQRIDCQKGRLRDETSHIRRLLRQNHCETGSTLPRLYRWLLVSWVASYPVQE
jgi:Ran GTPase-activating protein (RanGAP) involved in mRNA processing and transport